MDDLTKNGPEPTEPADGHQTMRAQPDDGPFEVRDTYAAQEQALWKAVWSDPAMDAYNDYDRNRR